MSMRDTTSHLQDSRDTGVTPKGLVGRCRTLEIRRSTGLRRRERRFRILLGALYLTSAYAERRCVRAPK
jgi:hypothetical protein